MSAAPLLRIRDLRLDAHTSRGPAHILRGVNLEIGRGRIVGLVGESGSGKSTLALCLLRLLPQNAVIASGEMTIDSVDLATLDENALDEWRGKRVAMIFQDPMSALNPLITIGTHLVDVLRHRDPGLSRRNARTQASAMLERVGIADARRRLGAYPHELSGGMRQRVMIAMALLVQPDLLLADEPTTALDATVEAQIIDLFADLRTDFAGSILFISHHLGLLAQVCDDIAVMYGGLIVETGLAEDVCSHPLHPYTAALLACELDDEPGDGRLASIAGDVPDPVSIPEGCIFAPRCTLVEARCRAQPQSLRTVANDRRVACWKAT